MRRIGFVLAIVLGAAAFAVPARAQVAAADLASAAPQVRRAVPYRGPNTFGFRLFGSFDADLMAASKTFKAVLGTSTLTGPGGGADIIQGHWFARIAISRAKHGGTRVFVADDQVFSLGIPTRIEILPFEIGGGWRSARDPRDPLSLYVGAGYLRTRFKESSDLADTGDDVNQWFNGFDVFGGVEYRVIHWISVGAEAQYRGVPNALGSTDGSPAQVYGETDLGGATVRVLVGVGH